MIKTSTMFLIIIVVKCTYYVQFVINKRDRDLLYTNLYILNSKYY